MSIPDTTVPDLASPPDATTACEMGRDAVLWAIKGGKLQTTFDDTEVAEAEIHVKAQEAIRAKYEAKKQALGAKMALDDDLQELSTMADSAAEGELRELERQFKSAKAQRAEEHVIALRAHHEAFHALQAAYPGFPSSPAEKNNAAEENDAVEGNENEKSTTQAIAGDDGQPLNMSEDDIPPSPQVTASGSVDEVEAAAAAAAAAFRMAPTPHGQQNQTHETQGAQNHQNFEESAPEDALSSFPRPHLWARRTRGTGGRFATSSRAPQTSQDVTSPAEGDKEKSAEMTADQSESTQRKRKADSVEIPAPPTKRSKSGDDQEQRTITFTEVYQDGNPQYKHMIVQFPKDTGPYYIMRCDEHVVHFRDKDPIGGAAKHLNSAQHGYLRKAHHLAIKMLGVRVVDCTPEQVQLNNTMVKAAFEAGYRPINKSKGKGAKKPSLGASSPRTADKATPTAKAKTATAQNHPSIVGAGTRTRPTEPLIRPKSGELYRAWWVEEKRYYPVLVLPWSDLSSLKFTDHKGNGKTLATIGLLKSVPRCYLVDRSLPAIVDWASGFGEGGEHMSRRQFPVAYFDGLASFGWCPARDLQEFDYSNPQSVPFFDEAVGRMAEIKGISVQQLIAERTNSTPAPVAQQTASATSSMPSSLTTRPVTLHNAKPTPGITPSVDGDSYRASEECHAETDQEKEATESRSTSVTDMAGSGECPQATEPKTPAIRSDIDAIMENAPEIIHSETRTPTPQNLSTQQMQSPRFVVRDPTPPARNSVDQQMQSPRFAVRDPDPPAQGNADQGPGTPRSYNASRPGTASPAQASPRACGSAQDCPSPRPKIQLPASSPKQASAMSPRLTLALSPKQVSEMSPKPRPEVTTTVATGPRIPGLGMLPHAPVVEAEGAVSKPNTPRATPIGDVIREGSVASLLAGRANKSQSPTMPFGLAAWANRSLSPSVLKTAVANGPELFEIKELQSDYFPGNPTRSVLLKLDKEAKTLTGTASDGSAIILPISKISRMEYSLKDREQDPYGRMCQLTILHCGDNDITYNTVLTIKPQDPMGRGVETGSVHARRLVGAAMKFNSQIKYSNRESQGFSSR